jgi:DNA invertase Pin-like site-specific DNA recombinase
MRPRDNPPNTDRRMIGYARVSTDEQDLSMQMEALRRAGVRDVNLYSDKQSGSTTARKGLEHALLDARPGDVLVVWKLDRLSRSLRDLLDMAERLRNEGVELRSLHEDIDTTTPHGRLFYSLMASLAEFERSLIGWRTKQGMAAARERGAKFGPPPKLGRAQVREAIKMLRAGRTPPEVAAHFGVSRQLIYTKVRAVAGKALWSQRKPRKTK